MATECDQSGKNLTFLFNKFFFFFPFGLLKIALADFHKTALFSLRALSEKVQFCVIFSQVSFLAYLILSLLSSLPYVLSAISSWWPSRKGQFRTRGGQRQTA
jgi:hypothetical protein